MEEQIQDAPEVLETPETVEETPSATAETPKDELSPEQIADLKKKADERDELEKKNKQLFERVKKAEGKSDALSNKDIIYLAKNDIHDEDVEEVLDLARLKKWDVKQAHDYLKPLLDSRAEMRRTAQATQTRSARSVSKVSGEELLAKAERTGELPESEDGMAALAYARMVRKLAKKH